MIFDLSKTAAVNGDAASAASSSSSQRRRRAPSSSRKRPAVHRRLVVAPVALLLSVLSLRSMRRMMTTSDATREYASSLVAELATNLPPGFHAETKLPSSSSSSSSSPACRPHFRLALPGGGWTDKTKFKRLYFYHVRKAGGTNLRRYFEKVASHHGLRFEVLEFGPADDPGSRIGDDDDGATLYVTHVREPVSRSISHFKYQGRWDCEQLVKNSSYVPTESIAQKLETWNSENGHEHQGKSQCRGGKDGRRTKFWLATCAVNCYSQWFSGLSCPHHDDDDDGDGDGGVPMARQYEVAKAKLLRYNFVVVIERLGDPAYAASVDRFFGVPGSANRDVHPWCEVEAQYTNKKIPVPYRNETLERLARLNEIDIGLYRELTDCLPDDGGRGGGHAYDFPAFDATRFETDETIRLDHDAWERNNPGRGYEKPGRAFRSKFDTHRPDKKNDDGDGEDPSTNSSDEGGGEGAVRSPSCRPHFDVASPDGNWTREPRFKRLYFYHTRKAGGTNLKQYFRKVAKHHGLVFASDEYVVAEDPGSYDDDRATFYVTNLREPVSRLISHFRYEGRWDCKGLTAHLTANNSTTSSNNETYVPTEDNAMSLEGWSENYGKYGRNDYPCAREDPFDPGNPKRYFKMLTCGAMCYSQWFAGLSCPPEGRLPMDPEERDLSLMRQYQIARGKLSRYNLVVITEWLRDPKYASAIERMFGVPGVSRNDYYPWCELESHAANEMIPLSVKNETLEKLTASNRFDRYLYDEFSECLKYRRKKDFPEWDASRFKTNEAIRMDYREWERLNPAYKKKQARQEVLQKEWLNHPSNRKWRIRFNIT